MTNKEIFLVLKAIPDCELKYESYNEFEGEKYYYLVIELLNTLSDRIILIYHTLQYQKIKIDHRHRGLTKRKPLSDIWDKLTLNQKRYLIFHLELFNDK